MTDKTSDKPQEDRDRPSAVLTTPASKRAAKDASFNASGADTSGSGRPSRSPLVLLALVVSLAALGVSAYALVKHRDIQAAHESLSRQVASGASELGQVDTRLSALSSKVENQSQRISTLNAELETASSVIRDLDEALRTMTDRGTELVLLNDVDHLATIAQQQLELGGNVRNAIVAMESAQAQLARANRPALASLLQTVNGDIDRLRTASTIDVGAFSQQLEELAMLLTDAPLIMPEQGGAPASAPPETPEREQPAPTVPPAQSAADTWWEQAWDSTREWTLEAWGSVRRDLGDFIQVRRVDDASALLMSPDQAGRLRESLRTRVMTAQLALMMRQAEIWRTETAAIVKAIETRYDESSPLTRRALRLARGMADAAIDTKLPNVTNTLQALDTLREEQSRSFHAEDPAHDPAGVAGGEPGPEPSSAESAEPADPVSSEPTPDAAPKSSQEPATQSSQEPAPQPASEPATPPAQGPSARPDPESSVPPAQEPGPEATPGPGPGPTSDASAHSGTQVGSAGNLGLAWLHRGPAGVAVQARGNGDVDRSWAAGLSAHLRTEG